MTSSPHPATPLTECTLQLSAEAGRVLLAEARAAMAAQLGQPVLPAVVATAAAWLRQPAATHVTLTLEGKLRGAAGAPPARQALCEDLRSNALAAAFHDPRFKAITSNELDALRIEVSVLSPLETLQWEDEAGALAQLRPGIDGVMVEYGHHRNLFLPQMWREFPDTALFVGNLKYKGGLPPDFWDATLTLRRFTAAVWREEHDHIQHNEAPHV
jgi:AmmeMemoRadiSam system protein A